MSSRDIAIDVIQRLPEGLSLRDIARELDFVAGVQEGFAEIEQGDGASVEDVRKMIDSWISR